MNLIIPQDNLIRLVLFVLLTISFHFTNKEDEAQRDSVM